MFYLFNAMKQIPAIIFMTLSVFFLLNPASYASDLKQDQIPENINGQLEKAVELIDKGMYENSKSVLLNIVKRDIKKKGRAYILLSEYIKKKEIIRRLKSI